MMEELEKRNNQKTIIKNFQRVESGIGVADVFPPKAVPLIRIISCTHPTLRRIRE
jgi:hypothetical protein